MLNEIKNTKVLILRHQAHDASEVYAIEVAAKVLVRRLETWVPKLALPLAGCVTTGKPFSSLH